MRASHGPEPGPAEIEKSGATTLRTIAEAPEYPAVDLPPCSLSDDPPQGHPCADLVYFSSEAETGSAVYNHLGHIAYFIR